MIWLLVLVALVLLIPLALAGVIALALYKSICGMSSPYARLTPVELEENTPDYDETMEVDAWAEANGFDWVGSYVTDFPGVPESFIGAWRRNDGTYIALYRMTNLTAIDFVTRLDPRRTIGLTTSNAKGAGTFPKQPGVFQQIFPDADVELLAETHAETLEFLATRLRLRPAAPDRPFDIEFMESVQRQMNYVRTHTLWPIRGVFWYLQRKRFDGVSVQQRHPNISPADLPD